MTDKNESQVACAITISPKCFEHKQKIVYFCISQQVVCAEKTGSTLGSECSFQEKHEWENLQRCTNPAAQKIAFDDACRFIHKPTCDLFNEIAHRLNGDNNG